MNKWSVKDKILILILCVGPGPSLYMLPTFSVSYWGYYYQVERVYTLHSTCPQPLAQAIEAIYWSLSSWPLFVIGMRFSHLLSMFVRSITLLLLFPMATCRFLTSWTSNPSSCVSRAPFSSFPNFPPSSFFHDNPFTFLLQCLHPPSSTLLSFYL